MSLETEVTGTYTGNPEIRWAGQHSWYILAKRTDMLSVIEPYYSHHCCTDI